MTRKLTPKATARVQHDSPKGPLGLTTLSRPDPEVVVAVDLIFVHGLNGGSQSTWSHMNRKSYYWPKEWLPTDEDFGGVRIHAFGYPSSVNRESVLNVRDFGWMLLAAIRDSPIIKHDKVRQTCHQMLGMTEPNCSPTGSLDICRP